MSDKSFITGDLGEEAVADILTERGYRVTFGPPGEYDLLIDDFLTVEVKTANLSGRTDSHNKRWQFSLTKLDGQHKPLTKAILILRCLTVPPCHFVIPGIVVPENLVKIDITHPSPSCYQGKWAAFYERWEMVDMVHAYVLTWGRYE